MYFFVHYSHSKCFTRHFYKNNTNHPPTTGSAWRNIVATSELTALCSSHTLTVQTAALSHTLTSEGIFCPSIFLPKKQQERKSRRRNVRVVENPNTIWDSLYVNDFHGFPESRSFSRGIQRLRVTWFHLIFRPRSPLTRTSLTGRATLIKPTFIGGVVIWWIFEM